jgi:hypothetical protein
MDQMLYQDKSGHRKKIDRPEWANNPDNMLSKEDAEVFNNANLTIPPRMEFEGNTLRADVVTRAQPDRGDLIFHFHGVDHPDFQTLLAEVVEAHFGTTDAFRVDRVIELPGTWGLLAKGARSRPMFNLKFYTEDFLWLLDRVLQEAR